MSRKRGARSNFCGAHLGAHQGLKHTHKAHAGDDGAAAFSVKTSASVRFWIGTLPREPATTQESGKVHRLGMRPLEVVWDAAGVLRFAARQRLVRTPPKQQ